MFKIPKSDFRYHWTNHAIRKMVFYGLSPDRIKRIIQNPQRVEEGVAERTVAVMQPGPNVKKPSEIWVMYQQSGNKRQAPGRKQKYRKLDNSPLAAGRLSKKIVISAWRYPGISPVGKRIPIPADIVEELKNDGFTGA